MEFKSRAGQNRQTPSLTPTPTSHLLPTATYISRCSLSGCDFAPIGFPDNVPPPNVFRTPVPVNAGEAIRRELEKEQIRRELEKEEIKREIIASEMARRQELEEEVRREMAFERALGIPMQRPEGFLFRPPVSMSWDPRMNNSLNNYDIFGGAHHQLSPRVDIRQTSMQTHTNKDKVIILAKPDPNYCGAKHKAVTLAVDDNDHSAFSLQKKPKQDWSCTLCQIITTSEKGLNEHMQGKKHKARETSLRTKKIGLDARSGNQKIQPSTTPANTGMLESSKKDQAGQKSQSLDGPKNENETTTEKEAWETNASTTRKKFKFWCAICEVETRSETLMQSHKNGEKHLANMKKFSQNNGTTNLG